jgi:glycosyltransferase involved in cell wall biosynthesis
MLQNKKICILSHFGSFQDSYALHVGWLERARMLEYFNIDFDFLVNDNCNTNIYPHQRNVLKNISKMLKFKERVKFFEKEYVKLLKDYDIILTCDMVYQRGGNFLPQNQAMRNASKYLKAHWFHWIHSAWTHPDTNTKYPDTLRNEMPPRSTLVYMNNSEIDGVAKMYNTDIKNVGCVWNPKDIRSFKDFHPFAWEVTKKLDIPNKDIIQIFPHCATRMDAKGINSIIKIFASLKDKGQKIALVMANGNASRVLSNIKKKKEYMKNLGLVDGEDFLFTHEITELKPFPRKAVADIFSISNIFIFASYREVSPNVLLEAKISDNLLVLNKRLKCVSEFGGKNAIYFESSFKTPGIRDGEPGDMQIVKYNNEKKYFYNLADAIIKNIRSKKHIWKFSYENIWKNQLYPLLNSAKSYEADEYKEKNNKQVIDISIHDDKKWNGVRREIRWFIDYLKPQRYLEIGIGDGRNFNGVPAKEKVCISPRGCVQRPNRMYHGKSDEIFDSMGEDPFDIIFIDGFHNYKQVVRDLNNSLKYLKPNVIIRVYYTHLR